MHKSLFRVTLRRFGGGGHSQHGLPKFDSPTVRTEEANRQMQAYQLDNNEPYLFERLSSPEL